MNTPAVKRFNTTELNGTPVSFTVDSQLLDYLEPARAFGAADLAAASAGSRYQPTVVAIPDHRPEALAPMLLSTGSAQHLRLLRRVANGGTELPASYETIDLSASFAHIAKGTVRAFAAAWTADDDKVTLAVAVDSSAPGNPSQILIAYDVSTRDDDWGALPWNNYGTRDALKVDGMRVVQEADGGWLTLMSAGAGVLANTFVIRQRRPGSFQSGGLVYSTAIDLTDIADFQVGGVEGDAALHVLGTNHKGKRVVITRKVPTLDANGNPVATPFFPLDCPGGANVLSMGLNRPGVGADLYTGGRGVQRLAAEDFEEQEDAIFETVMSEDVAPGVERLLVAEAADGAVTVWALDNAGRLLVASRPALEPGQRAPAPWSEPLVLRRGVHEIAAVPGDTHLSASVLVIHDEGGTSSLVRDARGIWQDEPITVADVGAATKLLTFQTVVAFKNDNGLPAAGRVRLSASVASTIVLNGHSHFVYPGNDAVLDIPADGKLTLSNRALSFSPATYRLKVDHWAQAIDINPASSLYQRFGTLTADDLRKASKADGQPLLGDAWRTGNEADSLDALVQSLKQAAQLATSKSGGADGIWLVNEGEIFSSRVAAASLPDGYSWGLASDGAGGLQPIDQTTANRLASQAGRTSSGLFGTGVSLSDAWEMIANAATDAVRFVVRKATDVIEFICEIGGRVGRFILNTLEEIGSFFKWLWASIKTAAEDVWDFLKFLFDWDDIIAVRNSVRDGFEDQLKALRKDVQGLRPIVAGFFDDGIRKVQDIKRSHGFPVSRPVGEQEIAAARKQGADGQDAAVNSGPGSWIMEQFGNVTKAFIDIELPDMPDTGPGMMDVFNRQLDNLSNMGSDIGGAIRSIFPDGNPSILDLSFEKIKEVVAAVGLNIAESALTMGKDLCLAMIDTLAALLDAFRAVMFARIRSPLIEKLWELISGEKKDLSFSIIDLVLLPPAVMGTILFKLIFPKVDIQAVARVRLPTDDVVAVQSDGLLSIAAVLKDVVSSCISFYSVMSGALSAAASVVKQKAIGKVKWVFWTLGVLAHLATPVYGAYKLVRDRKRIPSRMSRELDTLAWFVVLAQHSVKYMLYKLPEGMEEAAYAVSHKGLALGELGCNIVNLLLRSLAIAYAEEGEYPALPMVRFYCTTVGKALNAGAHLISHPKAKAALVVGAAGSGIGALVVAACHFRKAHLPVVQEAIAAL
ncbi:hypothetical protein [Burkholderia gladioli]|uniref:hypothetical protein n=1 Tax=Burkholderia gladioli TaxID=28095 RepID=UPI0016422A9E|nr:hypothetical protein [Burkholderia gladioli]